MSSKYIQGHLFGDKGSLFMQQNRSKFYFSLIIEVLTVQNRLDSSGMASSLCGLSSLCSFCGFLLIESLLLAILADSETLLCDEVIHRSLLFIILYFDC